MTRLRYLLREAVDNIRSNRTTTFVALATTTFTMLAMGVFLLVYLNVQEALGSLREEIKVIVYLRDAVSPQAVSRVRAEIGQDSAVAGIEYVSREQALATFRAQFRALVQKLNALSETEEVLYSQDWIENLAVALRYLEVLGLGIGTVLAASMVTILANTIRLTLHARRDEIEIMKLIGATTAFIKTPFVLEGALLGGVGALCSLFLLRTLFGLAEAKLALRGTFWGIGRGLVFLPDRVTVAFLLLGLMLGCLGSVVSLLRLRGAKS